MYRGTTLLNTRAPKIIMGLRNIILNLAVHNTDLMMAIEDIKTFHLMSVDKKLRVINPEAYKTQQENLKTIRDKYTETVTVAIEDNIDLVVKEAINELGYSHALTLSSEYITAKQIIC